MATLSVCTIRTAEEKDLDVLVGFEVEIARISFPDDPVIDHGTHRGRLQRALARDRQGMFVADREDRVVGWLWISLNQNFTTGTRYAQFRSLAVAPSERRGEVAQLLFGHGLAYVRESGVREVIGKVHVSNAPMRLIYRSFGFEPRHLTMRKVLP